MSTTFRSDRAAETIRAAAARIIREEVSDPGLGFVTLTACEVSHDLQNAKIFYTVLGDDLAREKAEAAFSRARTFLRSRIGEEIDLRSVPEISFRYDLSTDSAMRIEEILRGLPELNSPEKPEE